MSKRRRVIAIAVIVVAVAAGVGAYIHFRDQDQGAGTLVLYGNVDVREALLAFNNEGRIDEMLVEEGDRVKKGQPLATLEPSRYEAQLAEAKAGVATQQAALDRLLRGSRPEEIKQARANAKAIEAELVDARAQLRRSQSLVLSDFVARQKLDSDRARVETLEARLKAAEQALSLAIQGPRPEDIAEGRARLRAAEAALALATRRLDDTKLLAKADGIVLTRIVEPGQVVLANSPVYSIALTDPLWVRTYVSEPYLGRIHVGMKARIFTDSHPDKPFEGRVGFISPVAEFTPKTVETPEIRTSLVYRVRVYVHGAGTALRQGMPVTVRLKLDQPKARPGNRPAEQ
jgi:HlyD family secretion protein